jgi:hypothetical protein
MTQKWPLVRFCASGSKSVYFRAAPIFLEKISRLACALIFLIVYQITPPLFFPLLATPDQV